jgi:hypothetical protein
LGDTATTLAWAGIVLAVLGNIVYMLARLHTMQQQALRRQTGGFDDNDKMGAGAKDINENIIAQKEHEAESSGEYGAKAAQWIMNPDVTGAMSSLRPTFSGRPDEPEAMPSGGVLGGMAAAVATPARGVGCLPPSGGAPASDQYPAGGSGVTIDGQDPFAPAPADSQPRERLSALRQRVMGVESTDATPDAEGYTYSTDGANPGRSTVGSVVNCS